MKFAPLKSIADIKVGYQTRLRLEEKVDGTHRIIQGKDFDSSHQLQTTNLLSFFPERSPEHYSVEKGDVIFQARGSEHFAYGVDMDLPKTLISASFYIIRLKAEDILPGYLAWWLNQSPAQSAIHSVSKGTFMSYVSVKALFQVEIKLPPPATQQNIVASVNLWKKETLLCKKLQERRSALVQAICMNAIEK